MQIVNDWRAVDFNHEAPYVFPDDWQIIQNSNVPFSVFNSCEEFLVSEHNQNKVNHLHLGLLPNPYGGNIENADIIILTLNPGFTPIEYDFEIQNQVFRQAIIRAIYQENVADEFPFCALNPEFLNHPGFIYWAEKRVRTEQRAGNKFKHLANFILQTNYNGISNVNDAFRYFAGKTAVLEYMPYHSKLFDKNIKELATLLPSTIRLVEGLHTELIPQALNGDKLIICMRGPDLWEIQNIQNDNVIIYPSHLRQSASLSLNSPGGQAIINFIRPLI